MVITEEAKFFLKNELQYDYESGTLIWSKSKRNAVKPVRMPGGFRELVVDTECVQKPGESGFGALQAASICWLLHRKTWPQYGVMIVDRRTDDPNALRWSNLKKVGKLAALKSEVKAIESELVGRLIDFLKLTLDEKTRVGLSMDINVSHLVVQEMWFINELENVMKREI